MRLVVQFYKRAIRQFRKDFLISSCYTLILAALSAVSPYLLRLFLMNIDENAELSFAIVGILCFAALYFVRLLFDIQRVKSLDVLGGNFIESLLTQCQHKLSNCDYGEVEKLGVNNVKSMLFGDIMNVFRVIASYIPSVLSSFVVILVCTIVSLLIDRRAAAVTAAVVGIGIFLSVLGRNIIARLGGETNLAIKGVNSRAIDFVDSLPLVQMNGLEGYYENVTQDAVRHFISVAKREDGKVTFWAGLSSNYSSLINIGLSILLAMPFFGSSITQLVFFVTVASLMISNAQSIETMLHQIMRQISAFQNVQKLLTLPQKSGTEELPKVETVEFRKTAFRYHGMQTPVFENLNVRFQKGDLVKVEGYNGSGKSTFIKLLANLYAPAAGQILLDGLDIQNVKSSALRERILYISQDETFLNESIERYLCEVAGEKPDAEALKAQLEQLGLPGPERVIQNNGLSLSVGQRKKLLILKLLYRKDRASVIILDEIFAGLDAKTGTWLEKLICELAASGDKIIFCINHEEDSLPYTRHVDFGKSDMQSIAQEQGT